ncbi:MAG: DUF951 domain-containing protein [Firmicutes bacterium]|nr:DUF951 domain-containing protein [Bacillota bacterium]
MTKERINWQLGDIARMKKPHPCGSVDWRLERVGMDMRLVCLGCGRELKLPRRDFEKRVRQKISPAEQ